MGPTAVFRLSKKEHREQIFIRFSHILQPAEGLPVDLQVIRQKTSYTLT